MFAARKAVERLTHLEHFFTDLGGQLNDLLQQVSWQNGATVGSLSRLEMTIATANGIPDVEKAAETLRRLELLVDRLASQLPPSLGDVLQPHQLQVIPLNTTSESNFVRLRIERVGGPLRLSIEVNGTYQPWRTELPFIAKEIETC
jgi:hypothetical protein